jgi:hypothetical protein
MMETVGRWRVSPAVVCPELTLLFNKSVEKLVEKPIPDYGKVKGVNIF